MGGDNSPKVVIEGLALAHKRNPDIRFLVYGDEPKVTAEIAKYPALREACQIFHTDEFVHNEDKPSHVIRNRETSMYKAVEAVKNGQAMAVVSAGNTGALMAISKLLLKTIQKIHRPAIVSIMPHINGRYVMLDLGANTECDGINLAEFAIMGNIFAKYALGIEKPRVALMNIGAEEMKGKGEIHVAAHIIKNTHLTGEKTLRRKLKEIKLTCLLEKRYTKDEILEMYLNTIYFGRHVGDESIPRSAAKALADAVRHACAEDDGHGAGEREERLG